MEPLERSYPHRPARCPGCGAVVRLVVASREQVTTHVHNVAGCNIVFAYRCWLEPTSTIPRVAFVDTGEPTAPCDTLTTAPATHRMIPGRCRR